MTLTKEQTAWLRTLMGEEAEARSGGPAPHAPADPAVEAARKDLGGKYAVQVGAEGGASWKPAELNAVSQAFDAVPKEDKDALKGVEVDRVPAIGDDPDAAAEFQTSTDSRSDPATQTRKILVGDGTYTEAGTPADPAEAKRKIVHEVGHVVVKKAQNDADFAVAKAVVAFNKAIAARDVVKDQLAKAGPGQTAKPEKELADRRKDVAAAQAVLDATKAAAATTRVPKATADAGQARLDASASAADAASSGATAAATAMAAPDQKSSEEYRKASDAVAAQLKAYAAAVKERKVGRGDGQQPPDSLESALDAAIEARDAARKKLQAKSARDKALAVYEAVDRAQQAAYQQVRTQARLPDRPPKVQEFVDLVEANHIAPFPGYAAQNWPFRPEEFFAEAYSYWRTNRGKVPAALLVWFDKGQYR